MAGYTQSRHDHSLLVKKDSRHITILVVYVDYIVVTGSCEKLIVGLKQFLHSKL